MLERKYTVHLDSAAQRRMIAHVDFLALVSVSAAERLYAKLREEIDSLDYDPERYPVYKASKLTGIVFRYNFCAKRHRIVFRVIDDAVYVYDVQDCRQDTDKRLV